MATVDVTRESGARHRAGVGWSWPLWLRRVVAAGTGVAPALAFPPYGWWPLSVLAVAATTLLVRGLRTWSAAVVGLVVGVAFFLLQLRWLIVIGADAWVLLSLLEALFMAVLGAALALVQRLRWWPLWAAALWVAEELLRSVVPFGGFPW